VTPTSATASSARSHDRSPYRHALDGTQRALELALTRPPQAAESSVTLSRNAKGVAQFEVVIRHADPDVAFKACRVAYDALCLAYPYPVEASASPQEPAQQSDGVSTAPALAASPTRPQKRTGAAFARERKKRVTA